MPHETIDMQEFLRTLPVCGGDFLEKLQSKGVALHVHLLGTDKEVTKKTFELIRPCVEGFYPDKAKKEPLLLEVLDAAYYVLTLSTGENTGNFEKLTPEDVIGCLVCYWLPYPDNTMEVRYESVKTDSVKELLLPSLEWATHYLVHQDPFIRLNMLGENAVAIQIYLDLDDSPCVWQQEELEEVGFKHEHDFCGERLMENTYVVCSEIV